MSTESTLKIIFGGASHRRTSGYGWRVHPTKKTKKFHYGVDYGCGKVAVHALESGVVYKRGYDKSEHPPGYIYTSAFVACPAGNGRTLKHGWRIIPHHLLAVLRPADRLATG